jgi:hypothetical protein
MAEAKSKRRVEGEGQADQSILLVRCMRCGVVGFPGDRDGSIFNAEGYPGCKPGPDTDHPSMDPVRYVPMESP